MIFRSGSITGTGAVVKLSTAQPVPTGYIAGNFMCGKFVQMLAVGGTCLIGGAEVTTTAGFPLFDGSGQFTAPVAIDTDFYDLSAMCAYVPNGATLYLLYGG